ncbi:hypothetical protein ACVOMV_17575 [Mesorhizobium atlanticum]
MTVRQFAKLSLDKGLELEAKAPRHLARSAPAEINAGACLIVSCAAKMMELFVRSRVLLLAT